MAENTTFQAAAYTAQGAERDSVTLPATVFDGTVNMPVMHQAVKAYLANQRQGNAATKIRKYVSGGNQKPWKQKGTGRARQGSIRAPQWVGGGTVFGPIPRSYAQYVPRQVRQLARKSAFNARAARGAKSARKAASRAGAKKAATRGVGVAKKAAAKRPAAKKRAAKKSASKSTKKKGK